MSKYMGVLLLAVAVPFAASFWRPLGFYRNVRSLACSVSLIVALFGAWDVFATYRGHWSFNPDGVGGIRIINLPLEEWLFFIVIPFCCRFTWEALGYIVHQIAAQPGVSKPQ